MRVKSHSPINGSAKALASGEGIFIGLSSHALSLFNGHGSSFAHALAEYGSIFPSIEMKFTLPSLPSESVLHNLIEQKQLFVLWHFKLLDLLIDEQQTLLFFSRPEWQMMIRSLLEHARDRCIVIFALDRSIEYSLLLASKLEALTETLQPLRIAFEFEHGSWKKSEKLFAAIHVPVVELDAPRLPGLIRPLRTTSRRTALLCLVGHNAKAWLKHADDDRFVYTYSTDEIASVARRICSLKSISEQVFITCATYPAQSTLDCATSIIQEFIRQRTAEAGLISA